MRRILLTLALSLLLFVPAFGASPAINKAHNASYHIAQETATGSGADCSATAIGPQALLTASHCEMPTDEIAVVGEGNDIEGMAVIVGKLRDGLDHTILLVKNIEFPVFVDVLQKKPDQGDDVFTFGNPGDWTDVFQRGYVSSIQYDQSMAAALGGGKPPIVLIDFQAYPGTSGSGVFNNDGVLVFVVSELAIQSEHEAAIAFTGAYPMNFTADQLNKARTFTCPADPKPAPPEKKK